jgi:ArsR family transcriptional regulator
MSEKIHQLPKCGEARDSRNQANANFRNRQLNSTVGTVVRCALGGWFKSVEVVIKTWQGVHMSRHMDATRAIEALTALAQPTRLEVFRRLVSVHPDEIAAGEIARVCKVPHNTMSTHLAVLARAALVTVRPEGRMMHYGADLDGFRAVVGFLMRDCCNGRAEICAPLLAELDFCVPRKKRERLRG